MSMPTRSRALLAALAVMTVAILVGCVSKPKDDGKVPITTASNEARDLYIQARDLQEKFHFPESRESLARAVELDDQFAMAHLLLSFTETSTKGFLEALAKAVQAAEGASEGERLFIFAQDAASKGDPTMQGQHLRKIVELYPKDERGLAQLGIYYFGQQHYDSAVVYFSKAAEIAPEYSQAQNMLGYSHRALEQYGPAEEAFRKYTELLPDEPNPLDSYAELLLKIGRYEDALVSYRKVIDLDETFFASYIGAASALTYLDRHDEAREQLEAMHEKAANDAQRRNALFSVAVTYVDQSRWQEALEALTRRYELAKTIADDGAMAQDLVAMGNIHCESGAYEEAMSRFTEAIELLRASDLPSENKANAERVFLYNSARVALKTEDMEKARELAGDFALQATSAGNNFQIWLAHELAGMIAAAEGNFETALAEYAQGNPQNPYNLYRTALAHQQMGRAEQARIFCEKAANFNGLLAMNYSFIRSAAKEMLAEWETQ